MAISHTDRNLVSLKIAPELIHQALHLPDDVKLVGICSQMDDREILMVLENPEFPRTGPDEAPVKVVAEITTWKHCGEVHHKWKWNLPNQLELPLSS